MSGLSGIVTDFGTTRENARRIRIEKDAFQYLTGDVQTSLQALSAAIGSGGGGGALSPVVRLPAASTTVTLQLTPTLDIEVGIHTNVGGSVTVNLPAAASWQAAANGGLELCIFDYDGLAFTNNILISPSGSDTFVYPVSPIKITAAYGLCKLRPNGNPANSWYVRGIN